VSRRLWLPGVSRVMDYLSEWFKVVMKWEELTDEVRDQQYMVNIMVAEMHLCERLHVEKETLMEAMEKRLQ